MKKNYFDTCRCSFHAYSWRSCSTRQECSTKLKSDLLKNVQKEADALKTRIEQYTEKVEANKNKVDYAAEQARIKEMKAKWEALTGKDWEHEKKVEKM